MEHLFMPPVPLNTSQLHPDSTPSCLSEDSGTPDSQTPLPTQHLHRAADVSLRYACPPLHTHSSAPCPLPATQAKTLGLPPFSSFSLPHQQSHGSDSKTSLKPHKLYQNWRKFYMYYKMRQVFRRQASQTVQKILTNDMEST